MQAVLFDLDGTLLDLDLEAFLRDYFAALERAAGPLAALATGPRGLIEGLHVATHRMMAPHPGRINRDVFAEAFYQETGLDFDDHWHVFEDFYHTTFPGLAPSARPAPGARAAVVAARNLGLRVAVATNPIFPRIAVDHRIAWAGLDGIDFDLVTTYEHMRACKPQADYFVQVADELDVDPAECLMVGDDPRLDMPAADVGMRTFYVGSGNRVAADYRGTLTDLAALLPRLV